MTETSTDTWKTCEPGTLVTAGRAFQRQQLTQRIVRASSLAMLLLVTAYRFVGSDGLPYKGGITCAEAQQMAHPYLVGQLPAEDIPKVKRHLADCPVCRNYFKSLSTPTAQSRPTHRDSSYGTEHEQYGRFVSALHRFD
jgi:hypothetical protein